MITLRELEYVNGWARKVPYPGIEYAEKTAEKLVNAYEDFNNLYKDKKYDIITSSGEQILFEILDKNLCHMLGVDYKNLTDSYFDAQGFQGKPSGFVGKRNRCFACLSSGLYFLADFL